MASNMFDSVLYRDVFSTPAMRAAFSDEALLKAYVQAEVALAVAQGETGVIPREAAEVIAEKAPAIALDSAQLKHDTENVGYPIVGLVRQLSERLGEAGRYVHWGATTQDIMDTATVLQLREAVALIEAQLTEVMATLAELARLHRERRWPGEPISAGAADHVRAQGCGLALGAAALADRLEQAKPRACRRNSAAPSARWPRSAIAASTCAPPRRATGLAGLTSPGMSPRRAGRMVQTLAVICGALGKIGYDVMILMATEIGEVFEPFSSHAAHPRPCRRSAIRSRRKFCWPTQRSRATPLR